MTARPISRDCATLNFNHLRRGAIYRATTRHGAASGEYLGMETPHGDLAILLRHKTGTESIAVCDLTSIIPASL